MTAMFLALGCIVIWVLVSVQALHALGTPELLIGLVAQAPYAVFSIVHQSIVQRRFTWSPEALPQGIVTLRDFYLPWWTMLVYDTLLIAFGTQLGAVVGAFFSGDVAIANLIGFAGALIASYWVGHWTGVRIDRRGPVVVPAAVILARLANMLLDYLVLSDAEFQQYLGIPRTLIGLITAYLGSGAVLITLALCIAVGLFGLWLGRRARLSRYVWYLLRQLPAETRDTVIEMVYEDVHKLAAPRRQSQPPAPGQ